MNKRYEVVNLTFDRLKGNEGFEPKPYIDPLVAKYPEKYSIPESDMQIIKKHFNKLTLTWGYGFTFTTKEECDAVLQLKLTNLYIDLATTFDFYIHSPALVQSILLEMSYQIGLGGLSKFKNTLRYIKNHDYQAAAVEMLDSYWARVQTPSRAKELSKLMKGVK